MTDLGDGSRRWLPAAYRIKHQDIEALRWEPGDMLQAGGMISWLLVHQAPSRCADGMGETTTLTIFTIAGEQTARPGDWVIYTRATGFFVLGHPVFERLFELVPEDAPERKP